MNIFVWRLSKIPLFIVSYICNYYTLREIKNSNYKYLSKLRKPIQKSLNFKIDTAEKQTINKIEQLRQSYVKSNMKIPQWKNKEKLEKVSKLANVSSKSKFWSTLIFNIVREFKPQQCLELGTCIGISAIYEAEALKLNGKGKLITLEGSPERAKLAQKNFRKLELNNIDVWVGDFENNLEKVIKNYSFFDFVFIDGNHNYHSTVKYFEIILPFIHDNSIVIIDDTNYSKEMNNAWKKILKNEYVSASIEMFGLGVLLINRTTKQKINFSLAIPRI